VAKGPWAIKWDGPGSPGGRNGFNLLVAFAGGPRDLGARGFGELSERLLQSILGGAPPGPQWGR
jgi:hypothetical protein